jgi:hypothetical protein
VALLTVANECFDASSQRCRGPAENCVERTVAYDADDWDVPLSVTGNFSCCALIQYRANGTEPGSEWALQPWAPPLLTALVGVCIGVAAFATWTCVKKAAKRRDRLERERQQREDAATLGTVVRTTGGENGTELRPVTVRDEGETASLAAVLMIGVRRERVPGAALTTPCDEPPTESLGDSDDCCVCLGPYLGGSIVSVLPCGHRLHSTCLLEFVQYHVRRYQDLLCPICRANILATSSSELAQRREGRTTLVDQEMAPLHVPVRVREAPTPSTATPVRRPRQNSVASAVDDEAHLLTRTPVNPIGSVVRGGGESASRAPLEAPLSVRTSTNAPLLMPRYAAHGATPAATPAARDSTATSEEVVEL